MNIGIIGLGLIGGSLGRVISARTDDKVYAITKNGNYLIKKRLYELDKTTLNTFTYINQGCLANLKKVDHFEVSFGGALLAVFNSGYKDYVSRRQLKIVKERIGLKK